MTDNLDIWNKLSKTDPKHTKSFKRAGGFSGTAIKPIYQIEKMTETFGPVGDGWGMTEPVFQIVPGVNQEVMVYCTVGIWLKSTIKEGGIFYGVGGDKVVSYLRENKQYNRPERWENDDEAFKKAFTDAVGNAMKHLGMSADVHMGLFDDSKYIREREAEEAGADRQTGEVPPKPSREAIGASVAASEPLANQTAKLYFKVIQDDLMASTTLKQLGFAWSRHEEIINLMASGTQDELAAFKADLQHRMEEAEGGNLQAEGVAILEGKLREALIMDDLKKVWDLSSQALRKLKPEQVSYLNRVKEDMKGVIEGRELARAEQAARLAATP